MVAPTLDGALVGNMVAADVTGLADGSPVASVPDRVLGGSAWAQGTSARRPTYVAAGVGGRPSLSFDGVDDGLTGNGGLGTVLNGKPGATFIAVVRNTQATETVGITVRLSASSGNVIFQQQRAATRIVRLTGRLYGGGSNYTVAQTVSSIVLGADQVWTTGMNATTRDMHVRNNGGAKTTGRLGSSGTISTGTGAFTTIGTHPGQTEFFKGLVAEVLVYDRALTLEEETLVHSYASDEYGMTVADYDPAWNGVELVRQLRVGSAEPSSLRVGSAVVSRVYQGSTLVWEA